MDGLGLLARRGSLSRLVAKALFFGVKPLLRGGLLGRPIIQRRLAEGPEGAAQIADLVAAGEIGDVGVQFAAGEAVQRFGDGAERRGDLAEHDAPGDNPDEQQPKQTGRGHDQQAAPRGVLRDLRLLVQLGGLPIDQGVEGQVAAIENLHPGGLQQLQGAALVAGGQARAGPGPERQIVLRALAARLEQLLVGRGGQGTKVREIALQLGRLAAKSLLQMPPPGAVCADDLKRQLVEAGQVFLGQLGQPQVGGMHIDQPLLIGRQLPDAAGRQEGQSGPEQGEHREHGQDLVGNPRGPETCHLSSPDTWPAAAHRGACRRTREQDLGSGLEKVRVDSPWRGPGRPLTASAVWAAALRKFGDHASGALNASLCGPGCRCGGGAEGSRG